LPSDDLEKTKEWIQGCHDRGLFAVSPALHNMILMVHSENNWNFAIELLQSTSSTRVIGLIGAVRAPEVGYMFNASYWGQGYATEALRAFVPLFFEHFSGCEHEQYKYAEALTDTELVSSQNVLLKVGFKLHERREKDFDNPVLGIRDTLVYRIERPETGGTAKPM
jgi:RimJ/RimL family protein N-acetyltransferase